MKKLNVNFNMTFSPDRLSLARLLVYLYENEYSSIDSIKSKTGITNGNQTGKIRPYIDYLSGMGLLDYVYINKEYQVNLTRFGKSVIIEDPQMSMHLTQWLCHAFMCDLKYGNYSWIAFFNNWNKMENRDIDLISEKFNIDKVKFTPLINMYCKEECYGYSKIIKNISGTNKYMRSSAPLINEYLPAYGAFLIYLLKEYFPQKEQVSIFDFENITGFSNRFGWDISESEQLYSELTSLGYIKINALLSPKCIQGLVNLDYAWNEIYSEIL